MAQRLVCADVIELADDRLDVPLGQPPAQQPLVGEAGAPAWRDGAQGCDRGRELRRGGMGSRDDARSRASFSSSSVW
jgi:hypothetical protein